MELNRVDMYVRARADVGAQLGQDRRVIHAKDELARVDQRPLRRVEQLRRRADDGARARALVCKRHMGAARQVWVTWVRLAILKSLVRWK